MDIVYKNYQSYTILGQVIDLFFDEETCYGLNTVLEINNNLHYLGDEPANISAVISCWEELNGKFLSQQELKQVMVDNNLISDAI